MAGLVQQLDTYSKIGIPKLHHHATFEYEDEVEEGEVKNSRFGSPNEDRISRGIKGLLVFPVLVH